eukprot:4290059-Prymnesium_polylepis.1
MGPSQTGADYGGEDDNDRYLSQELTGREPIILVPLGGLRRNGGCRAARERRGKNFGLGNHAGKVLKEAGESEKAGGHKGRATIGWVIMMIRAGYLGLQRSRVYAVLCDFCRERPTSSTGCMVLVRPTQNWGESEKISRKGYPSA